MTPVQHIYVSQGEKEFVGGTITETTGKDITAAVFQLGLGSQSTPPTVWSTPDVDEPGTTPNIRTVKLLIDDSTPTSAVYYYCWAKITDNPEIPFIRFERQILVS